MDFARPSFLLLLGLVPLAIALEAIARRKRLRAWSLLGRPGRPIAVRSARWIVLLVGLIVALAGPRIGRAPGSELPPGHDVVLLVDASRSMAAEDVIPDRIGAAVAAASGLARKVGSEPGGRVAVVAFAGDAEPRCPLTERVEAAEEALQAIRPGGVTPGGTDLGRAILAALDTFDPQEPAEGRAIVVLTDGEDLAGSWPLLLERLEAARVAVHGVTFGDADAGHVIPVGERRESLRYRGETVLSRRADKPLAAICEATGGTLVRAGLARADLAALYRDRIEPSELRRHAATATPERVDRASVLIAGALGLLTATSWPRSRRLGTLLLLLAVGIGAAPAYRTAREAVAAGEAAYRAGKWQEAADRYEVAIPLDPNSPLPAYDTAAALYQLGRYDDARRRYEEARGRADPVLAAKIDYALGNVAVASGRYKDAIGHYDACLAARATGPAIEGLKRDARANRAFAERLIPPPASPDPEGNRKTPDPERPADGPRSPDTDPKSQDGNAPPGPSTPPGAPGGANPKGNNPAAQEPPGGPNPGASPEERLDSLLNDVRKGQRAGRDAPPPPASATTDRRDW